jgi:hypothetical protein
MTLKRLRSVLGFATAPGQSLSRRLLLPVRPGIGAEYPAASAHHARSERRTGAARVLYCGL